ncbi:hypothetical protein ACEZ6V_000541 [Escherichia coli]
MTSPLLALISENAGDASPARLRLKFIHRTAPSSSLNGNSLHRLNGFPLPEFLRPIYTLLITSALYMTGCGLHLPKGICCRVTANLHQTVNFLTLRQTRASVAHAE